MIADVIKFAIAGIGFYHAAARLLLHQGFTASMNTVMTQNWTRRRDQRRERDISALSRDP